MVKERQKQGQHVWALIGDRGNPKKQLKKIVIQGVIGFVKSNGIKLRSKATSLFDVHLLKQPCTASIKQTGKKL